MPGNHKPTTIVDINVARDMYGTTLAPHLLALMQETHPQDPRIDMAVYEGNHRSQAFHGKLGFVLDEHVPPFAGAVYEGQWVTMCTTGETFAANLQAILSDPRK